MPYVGGTSIRGRRFLWFHLKRNYMRMLQSKNRYVTVVEKGYFLWRRNNHNYREAHQHLLSLRLKFNCLQVVSLWIGSSSPLYIRITFLIHHHHCPNHQQRRWSFEITCGYSGIYDAAPIDMVESSIRNSSTVSLLQHTQLCQSALQDLLTHRNPQPRSPLGSYVIFLRPSVQVFECCQALMSY